MNRISRSSRLLALTAVLASAVAFPVGAQGAAMKHPAMKHHAMKKHHAKKKHPAMKHHAMKHGK